MGTLFGKSYSDVGNISSDLLLKTRGLVKIQFGNKFIDLIKDGKLNAQSKFIYESDTIGSKDGIYIVDGNATIVINELLIPLTVDGGNAYVSFLVDLKLTREQQLRALTNIGFIYKTLDEIKDIQNGIIYVEETGKLYTINDGNIKTYSSSIPNPFTNQFILKKEDSNIGSLVIIGKGKENGIKFDTMSIWDGFINFNKDIKFTDSNNNKVLELNKNSINADVPILIDEIYSKDGSFAIYNSPKGYTLKVDNIICSSINSSADLEYLSKTKDDETPYTLTVGGLKTTNAEEGLMNGLGIVAKSDGSLEVDTLKVRKKAIFNELEIKKTGYVGGDIIYSFAGNKIVEIERDEEGNPKYQDYGLHFDEEGNLLSIEECTERLSVEGTHTEEKCLNFIRCYFLALDGEGDDAKEITNDWRVGDLALCKVTNLKTGSNQSNRYYWRLVIGYGTTADKKKHWVDLSTIDNIKLPGRDNPNILVPMYSFEASLNGTPYLFIGYDGVTKGTNPEFEGYGTEFDYAYDSDKRIHNDFPLEGDSIVLLGNQVDPKNRGYAYAIYVSEARRVDYYGIGNSSNLGGWKLYYPYNLNSAKTSDLSPLGWTIENKFFNWSYKDVDGNIKETPNVIFMGDWDASIVYYKNMSVFYIEDSCLYLCIDDEEGGGIYGIPPTDTNYWKKISSSGESTPGASTFVSIVFVRSVHRPKIPTGGNYRSPIPTGNDSTDTGGEDVKGTWSDGIPGGDSSVPIWSSRRKFSTDLSLLDAAWSYPRRMSDTSDIDILYWNSKDKYTEEPNPNKHFVDENNGWMNTPNENTTYMAIDTLINGVWLGWKISKIVGETGPQGPPGMVEKNRTTYFLRYKSEEGVYIRSGTTEIEYTPDFADGGTSTMWKEPTEEFPFTWSWDYIVYTNEIKRVTAPTVIKRWAIGAIPGEDGKPGQDGEDAYSVIVVPNVFTFEMDENGYISNPLTNNTASVHIYKGSSELKITNINDILRSHCLGSANTTIYNYAIATIISIDTVNLKDENGNSIKDALGNPVSMPYGSGYISFNVTANSKVFHVLIPFTISGSKYVGKVNWDNKLFQTRFEKWTTDDDGKYETVASQIDLKADSIAMSVTDKIGYMGTNLLPMSDFKTGDPSISFSYIPNLSGIVVYPKLGELYNGQLIWVLKCTGIPNDGNSTYGCLRFVVHGDATYTARTYIRKISDIKNQSGVRFFQFYNTIDNGYYVTNTEFFQNNPKPYKELSNMALNVWEEFETKTEPFNGDYSYLEFDIIIDTNGYIEFTTPIIDNFNGELEPYPYKLDHSGYPNTPEAKVILSNYSADCFNDSSYLRFYTQNQTENSFNMLFYSFTNLMKDSSGVKYDSNGNIIEKGDKIYTYSVYIKRKHNNSKEHYIHSDCVDEIINKNRGYKGLECNSLPQNTWTRINYDIAGTSNKSRLTIGLVTNGDIFVTCPLLEYGKKATDWSLRPSDTDIRLRRTGIDITSGRIDMQADHFTLRNAAGEQTMGVDASGNAVFNGGVNATSGTFSGNIFANSFEIRNGDKPGIRFYTDLTGQPHFVIYNKDGKFMFDLADGGKSVVDNSQQPYYTAKQILGVTLNSIGIKSYDAVPTIVYKYHAFRFNGVMTQPDKVYDGKYFVNNTDAASDNNLMQVGNYAVRRVQGGERVVVYSFVNGEMANLRELTSNDYTTIKPGGGIIVTSNGGMVATSLDELSRWGRQS